MTKGSHHRPKTTLDEAEKLLFNRRSKSCCWSIRKVGRLITMRDIDKLTSSPASAKTSATDSASGRPRAWRLRPRRSGSSRRRRCARGRYRARAQQNVIETVPGQEGDIQIIAAMSQREGEGPHRRRRRRVKVGIGPGVCTTRILRRRRYADHHLPPLRRRRVSPSLQTAASVIVATSQNHCRGAIAS
jgi:hypothetical protein